jgi:hypothetical protein
MPGDSRECRIHALRCLELAKTAMTPQAKAKFLDLAEHWASLASDLDALARLLEEDNRTKDAV